MSNARVCVCVRVFWGYVTSFLALLAVLLSFQGDWTFKQMQMLPELNLNLQSLSSQRRSTVVYQFSWLKRAHSRRLHSLFFSGCFLAEPASRIIFTAGRQGNGTGSGYFLAACSDRRLASMPAERTKREKNNIVWVIQQVLLLLGRLFVAGHCGGRFVSYW